MGKSNSKLKPEVVEELTRKTYCEYLQLLFLLVFIKIKHFNSSNFINVIRKTCQMIKSDGNPSC